MGDKSIRKVRKEKTLKDRPPKEKILKVKSLKIKEPKKKAFKLGFPKMKLPKPKNLLDRIQDLNKRGLLNSISTKLLGVFGVTMFSMLVLIIVFIVKALGYNQEYQAVLENVNKINYIKTEISAQPNRLMSLCMMQKNVEESDETAIVDTMLRDLDEISQSIGTDAAFQGNQGMIVSIRTPLVAYQEGLNKIIALGKDGNYPALDPDITAMLQSELFSKNTSIANYCGSLITMEIDRSKIVQQEVNQNFRQTIITVGIAFILLLIIGMGCCTAVVRDITKRVHTLKKEISIVAQGDLSRKDIVIRTDDEIKDLAIAFNHMSNSLRKIIGKMVRVTEEMEHSTRIVSKSVEVNSKGSREVSESIEQMSMLMEKQNEMTDSTLKQVADMESASNKISEGIKRISENADISMERAKKGSDDIKQYTEQLSQVNDIMSQISGVASQLHTSTQEMNTIIESITNISSMTTLLSLNASIEAARAGEAGRGFAVVATEIKKLADDTQEAASRIGSIISQVQDNVVEMTDKMETGLTQLNKSNEIARVTQGSFQDIREGTLVVNKDIQDIVTYIEEMSRMVEYVTTSVRSITDAIEENTSTTVEIAKTVDAETESLQEVAGTAGSLKMLARELQEVVSEFRLEQTEESSVSEPQPESESEPQPESDSES